MPRKRKIGPLRRPEIPREWWALLNDAPLAEGANPFARFTFDTEAPGLWATHRVQILRDWVSTWPGTRPSCWWRFDAPRMREIPARYRGCYFAGTMIEPRLRLSGAGVPAHEALRRRCG